MSWALIEREIARGGLGEDETKELWDCLWLDRDEVRGLLEHVRQAGGPAYLHPRVCFAAYTGARRSELCRSQVADWRFDDKTAKIRQKKRDKEKWFTDRDVPIDPVLAEVLKAWFDGHPGGRLAFCRDKRDPVTWDIATYHLKEALRESKWKVHLAAIGGHCLPLMDTDCHRLPTAVDFDGGRFGGLDFSWGTQDSPGRQVGSYLQEPFDAPHHLRSLHRDFRCRCAQGPGRRTATLSLSFHRLASSLPFQRA
jgi:hypothetical protein